MTDSNRLNSKPLVIVNAVSLVLIVLVTTFALGYALGNNSEAPVETKAPTGASQANDSGTNSYTENPKADNYVDPDYRNEYDSSGKKYEGTEDFDRPWYPECKDEDSTPQGTACYWNASKHGNGQGKSFIKYADGTVEYVD